MIYINSGTSWYAIPRFLSLDLLRYTEMDSAESSSHNTQGLPRRCGWPHRSSLPSNSDPRPTPCAAANSRRRRIHITWLKTETEVCLGHYSTVSWSISLHCPTMFNIRRIIESRLPNTSLNTWWKEPPMSKLSSKKKAPTRTSPNKLCHVPCYLYSIRESSWSDCLTE
jgi:hypothetical protein